VVEQPEDIWTHDKTVLDDLECGCCEVVLPLWTSSGDPGSALAVALIDGTGEVSLVHTRLPS
jgi:hypothetical protein